MFEKHVPAITGTESTDRAVSPVVGVVLMIVLAVSLTVVVGGFTNNLVDQATVDPAPHATIDVYTNSTGSGIQVAHDGGEDLRFSEIDVSVRREGGGSIPITTTPNSGTLAPGDTFLIEKGSGSFTDGAKYKVTVFDRKSGNIIDEGTVTYGA